MKKKVKTIVVSLCCCMILGGTALAGMTHEAYSTTVGKINGNGYTNTQTKAYLLPGWVETEYVGGGYEVDARMQCPSSGEVGSWCRDLATNDSADLGNTIGVGKAVRVQFSNDLTTLVDVQVSGEWASN
jgi:hypothetical protein